MLLYQNRLPCLKMLRIKACTGEAIFSLAPQPPSHSNSPQRLSRFA